MALSRSRSKLGVPLLEIAAALAEFQGAERRFQKRGEVHGVLVVDDYGHHPTEIAAVLAAARGRHRPPRRRGVPAASLSRGRPQLLEEFGAAFRGADAIVLTDIYAAGEKRRSRGSRSRALADASAPRLGGRVTVIKALDDVPRAVAGMCRPGDLVITLGAGSIGGVGDRILAEFARAPALPAGAGGES